MEKNNLSKFKKSFKRRVKISSFNAKKLSKNIKKSTKNFVFMNWTWPKKVFLGIIIIVLIGTILLYLPISYNYTSYEYRNNEYIFHLNLSEADKLLGKSEVIHVNFIKAMFVAVSAFTDTGLTAGIEVGTHMNFFGQFVVYSLIQVGGFGYISLFYLLGKSIYRLTQKNIFSKSMLHIERGGSKISQSSKMIVRLFFILTGIQFIASLILASIIYSVPFYLQQDAKDYFGITVDSNVVNDGYQHFDKALWHGVFLSSAALNNAGFDLFGSSSLSLFRNDLGIIVQVLLMFLFVLGGIGFPIIYDFSMRIEWYFKTKILAKYFNKTEHRNIPKNKYTSFTKICLTSYFTIGIVSIGLAFMTEYLGVYNYDIHFINNGAQKGEKLFQPIIKFTEPILGVDGQLVKPFGELTQLNINWNIIFNVASTRSAGFATVGLYNLTESTKILFIITMFIGACPSSNGGGIRTTTIAVMFKSMMSWLRGLDRTSVFKRTIPNKTVTYSFLIFLLGFVIMCVLTTAFFFLSFINNNGNNFVQLQEPYNFTFVDYLFDMSSAFGTTGLSTGISNLEVLPWWTLLPLIVMMLIGQLGIGATLEIFARKIPKRKDIDYLEEDIRLG